MSVVKIGSLDGVWLVFDSRKPGMFLGSVENCLTPEAALASAKKKFRDQVSPVVEQATAANADLLKEVPNIRKSQSFGGFTNHTLRSPYGTRSTPTNGANYLRPRVNLTNGRS